MADERKRALRKSNLLLGLAVLVGVAVGGFLLLRAWANPGYTPTVFERKEWANGSAEQRGHMVNDLLSRHDIVGMTKEQVVELLGEPDDDEKNWVCYHLGHMERNPTITWLTKLSLLIVFGEGERVTYASVVD